MDTSMSLAFFERHSTAFIWTGVYIFIKIIVRQAFGEEKSWDPICLVHNIWSVIAGCVILYLWERPGPDSCNSISEIDSLVIMLQVAHCISDFVVYLQTMLEQQIFLYHHGVLLIASLILPYCPGCLYTTIAYSVAELGSCSIAIDAEWRKMGGYSRGLKRVIIFGTSRVANCYLLYRIWLVTPSSTYFSVFSEGEEIVTVNVPICMITSVGGSVMLLIVNGTTWFRMFKSYRKFKKVRMAEKKTNKSC